MNESMTRSIFIVGKIRRYSHPDKVELFSWLLCVDTTNNIWDTWWRWNTPKNVSWRGGTSGMAGTWCDEGGPGATWCDLVWTWYGPVATWHLVWSSPFGRLGVDLAVGTWCDVTEAGSTIHCHTVRGTTAREWRQRRPRLSWRNISHTCTTRRAISPATIALAPEQYRYRSSPEQNHQWHLHQHKGSITINHQPSIKTSDHHQSRVTNDTSSTREVSPLCRDAWSDPGEEPVRLDPGLLIE